MDFALAPDAVAAGYGLAVHDTIGSTSTEAMVRLRAGEGGPFWVVTRRQTAGRGRRGAGWSTESGNLAASLALRLDAPPATVATLGFVAGVALARTLDGLCPPPWGEGRVGRGSARTGMGVARDMAPSNQPRPDPHPARAAPESALPTRGREGRLALKWPNDVLAGGAKLAGILLETEEARQGRAVVIGIGVNVAHAPDGLPYRTAALRSLGSDTTAEALFAALSAEWLRAFAEWDGGRGFAAIRDAWLARAAGLGRPVAVRAGGAPIRGIFDTIDASGQLVLRLPDGTSRAVSAGEVHFGDAAGIPGSEAA